MTLKGRKQDPAHTAKVAAALKGRRPSDYTLQRAREVNSSRVRTPEENKRRGRPGRISSIETRKKISESQKGKVLSEETKKKISQTLKAKGTNTPESVAKIKQFWANLTLEQKQEILARRKKTRKTTQTSIEIKVQYLLNLLEVPYFSSYKIGPFTCDFFLPTLNMDLECDGDYWHSLPAYLELDPRRDLWMRNHGLRVLRISETVIKKLDYGDMFRLLVDINTMEGFNVPETGV